MSVPYQEASGCLVYLMIGSRPDIGYAVGRLSQLCDPQGQHRTTVKRVSRFINGTKHTGIPYKKKEQPLVIGYTDSDWAEELKDEISTSGYVFMICGSAVSWSSRKQTVVAMSSCEAEYIAVNGACKEALWLKRLVEQLPSANGNANSMKMFCHSQSGIEISRNESINRRNKHINNNFNFVSDVVAKRNVQLECIHTKEIVADVMTWSFCRMKFEYFPAKCVVQGKSKMACSDQGVELE